MLLAWAAQGVIGVGLVVGDKVHDQLPVFAKATQLVSALER